MNFQPRTGLGKLLIAISVVCIIAALYSLFFYVDETDYSQISETGGEFPPEPRPIVIDRCPVEAYTEDVLNTGPIYRYLYRFPYRWLSEPLAIVGISLFLTGFLVGYYDDIF